MFGYIQPLKSELLVKDYEAYKAVYCSLCKQLGKSYGVAASLILSYDATYYAILYMSVKGECNSYKVGRCKVNPLKKCNYCQNKSNALEAAAALSVAAFYYKLEDDRADSGFFKRLAVRFVKPFVRRWRKKMLKLGYSDFDNIFAQMIEQQSLAEQDTTCGIDKAAQPTAQAMSKICSALSSEQTQKRVLESFGYYLGKWIYLMDAADDLSDDLKRGGFNPFVNAFSLAAGYDEEKNAEEMNSVINESSYMILNSYNLIDLKGNKRILDNFAELGLSAMQKQVLFDKKHKKRKDKNSDIEI